jgi:ABC-type amino acid transport substrate-binding protein
MRTLLVPAAFAALLATSAIALAATSQASGTVKAFDAKAMTLILADGDAYVLPRTFKDPGLKAGEHVSINWQMKGDQRAADSVTILK